MTQHPEPQKKRAGPLAAAAAGLALLFATVGGAAMFEAAENGKPAALATALYGPDTFPGEDNRLIFKDGRVEVQTVTYREDGHAGMPRWQGKLPIPGTAQLSPVMGWSPPYVAQIASGSRPLRWCIQEVRAYDAQRGTQIAVFTEDAIRGVWDRLFEVPASVEDCANPDLILGASAAQDCGSAGAWGCASFNGRTTRVTFNGEKRASGELSDRAIRCAIWDHEMLHALDLGHTGEYGGEGRPHSHVSSLGYVGANGCPVDNPNGVPPILDYADGGGGYRYNLRLRGQNPTPTPTPVGVPPPPSGFRLTEAAQPRRATVGWNPVQGATSYLLCLARQGGDTCERYEFVAPPGVVLDGLAPGAAYVLWVSSCAQACGGWSAGFSFATPTEPTPSPSPSPPPAVGPVVYTWSRSGGTWVQRGEVQAVAGDCYVIAWQGQLQRQFGPGCATVNGAEAEPVPAQPR